MLTESLNFDRHLLFQLGGGLLIARIVCIQYFLVKLVTLFVRWKDLDVAWYLI